MCVSALLKGEGVRPIIGHYRMSPAPCGPEGYHGFCRATSGFRRSAVVSSVRSSDVPTSGRLFLICGGSLRSHFLIFLIPGEVHIPTGRGLAVHHLRRLKILFFGNWSFFVFFYRWILKFSVFIALIGWFLGIFFFPRSAFLVNFSIFRKFWDFRLKTRKI